MVCTIHGQSVEYATEAAFSLNMCVVYLFGTGDLILASGKFLRAEHVAYMLHVESHGSAGEYFAIVFAFVIKLFLNTKQMLLVSCCKHLGNSQSNYRVNCIHCKTNALLK